MKWLQIYKPTMPDFVLVKFTLSSFEIFTKAIIYLDANPPMGLMVLMSSGAASNSSFWMVSPKAVK
jgi:hypothetical protein